MIRKLQETDIERIAEIWLDTNMSAHHFICQQYWTENYERVKNMFSLAEVYVYEDGIIQGFIGLENDYLAGIFVWREMQSNGIGHQLLDFAKSIKKQLRLSVYTKNTKAVAFYKREDFKIQSEEVDPDTGEKEYTMVWILPPS